MAGSFFTYVIFIKLFNPISRRGRVALAAVLRRQGTQSGKKDGDPAALSKKSTAKMERKVRKCTTRTPTSSSSSRAWHKNLLHFVNNQVWWVPGGFLIPAKPSTPWRRRSCPSENGASSSRCFEVPASPLIPTSLSSIREIVHNGRRN